MEEYNMKNKLLIILLFLPLLLLGDSKTYNKQLVINLWNKNLGETTEIKKAFDEVANKYGLEVQIENIPDNDINWKEIVDVKKEKENK